MRTHQWLKHEPVFVPPKPMDKIEAKSSESWERIDSGEWVWIFTTTNGEGKGGIADELPPLLADVKSECFTLYHPFATPLAELGKGLNKK